MVDYKILHLSHNPLPDIRVEKSAYTMVKQGAELYFAGPPPNGSALPNTPFKNFFNLNWSREVKLHLPFYWRNIKLAFKKILKSLNPDIVHAHNIFAAKLASESRIRMVYDDHEYWPLEFKAMKTYTSISGLGKSYLGWITAKWEKDILSKAPVIDVSPTISDEHSKQGKSFLIPNLPNKLEIGLMSRLSKPLDKLSCVIVGNDFPPKVSFRDTSGLIEVLSKNDFMNINLIGPKKSVLKVPYSHIKSRGYLSHSNMLKELCSHHVGLIPWRPHWYHRYCNVLKAYHYAHAGLIVVVPFTMRPIVEVLGHNLCRTFKNYNELVEILMDLSKDLESTLKLGLKTREYAKDKLTWEKYENRISEAYEATKK